MLLSILVYATFSIHPTLLPPLCPQVGEGGIFLPLQVSKDWVKMTLPKAGLWLCFLSKERMGKYTPAVQNCWRSAVSWSLALTMSSSEWQIYFLFSHLPIIKNRILAPIGKRDFSLALWPHKQNGKKPTFPMKTPLNSLEPMELSHLRYLLRVCESLEGSALSGSLIDLHMVLENFWK